MPTKRQSPAVPAKRNFFATLRYYWPLTAIVLVFLFGALAAIGTHVVHARAIREDRERFVIAEKDVADLSRQILGVTPQPLKVSTEKTCTKPNLELNNGPLSCDINDTFFYNINNESDANDNFRSISEMITLKWPRSSTKYSSNILNTNRFQSIPTSNYSQKNDYQQIYQTYSAHIRGMICTAVYDFYPGSEPPFSNYINNSASKFLLAVSLDCGDYAKAQYFPLNH